MRYVCVTCVFVGRRDSHAEAEGHQTHRLLYQYIGNSSVYVYVYEYGYSHLSSRVTDLSM